jgi:Mn2+/Fe2+ NRAMP family transporter
MAVQFEPLFGKTARVLMGVGLFAAGLSSAITAPLATAYATTEILGLQGDSRSRSFRLIALSVLFIGATLALTGIKPITLILMAQFANGLILPVIAGFLLWAMNNKGVLGTRTNGITTNVLGGLVIVVTAILGARSIGSVFGLW